MSDMADRTSCCAISHWSRPASTWTARGAGSAIAPPDAKKCAGTGYSDQPDSCCPLLIFNLIDSLFIAGTMLYYMPPLAARTDITYFSCKRSPGTASDSSRLSAALHSRILVCSAFAGSPTASCNIDCID